MRAILACVAAATLLPAFAGEETAAPARYSPPRKTVYLDDSRIFDAIRAKDPARYDRIIDVLRVAEVEPCETVPQILKTQYQVNGTCQGYQVYTSFPAKTLLTFTVEDTDYVAFVVQRKLSGGKLIPAK